LQNIDTPRPSNAKGGWLPFTFTWITAAQNWRRVVFGEIDWTWGDGTWVWSDGTAEFGTGAQTFTLTAASQAITVNHGGTIDAPNVTLRFAITGQWQDVSITNETTGQQIVIARDNYDAMPLLEINAGTRTIYAGGAAKTLTSVYRNQNRINATVNVGHGLADGDTMRLEDAGEYDGIYYPVDISGANNALAAISPASRAYGTQLGGVLRELVELYNETTFYDVNNWLVLAPGDNVLRIAWTPFPVAVTLTVEFVDHYG
jgi:hypothetical protein